MPSAKPPKPAPIAGKYVALRVWALAEAFEARLGRELARHGLSVAGFRLVGELMVSPAGLRHGELARRLGVKPPSVTAMVAKLQAAGLVTTSPDPGDARAIRVKFARRAPLGPGLEILARMDRALVGRGGRPSRGALERTLDQLISRLKEDEAGASEGGGRRAPHAGASRKARSRGGTSWVTP